jgi:hypothetical protein
VKRVYHGAVVGSDDAIQPLSADKRLGAAETWFDGFGCLYALAGLVLVGGAIAIGAHWLDVNPAVGATAVAAFIALAFIWMGLWFRYRHVFFREALRVPDGLAKPAIPRVVQAPSDISAGMPLAMAKLRVRTLSGRAGKCQIQLFEQGLQIWRGPNHPVPRWQFEYSQVALAEPVQIETPKGPNPVYLRLVIGQPRMVFLCGPTLNLDRDLGPVLKALSERGVQAFANV